MTTASVFTVLGASGFIGQALVRWLRKRGHEVLAPERQLTSAELSAFLTGHVLYCIGLTADFRSRPWETVDAHVGLLRQLLANANFSSLTYLSSTRVYEGSDLGHEDATICVQPQNPDQLFNLSKLMGESLCHRAHRHDRPVRVVRLSNVLGNDHGSDNFFYALLREARLKGTFHLKSSLDSTKDYITLSDAIRMLELIGNHGRHSCYNLASGIRVRHGEVAQFISKLTGASFTVEENAPETLFPPIDISRLQAEFDFTPQSPLDSFASCLTNQNQ